MAPARQPLVAGRLLQKAAGRPGRPSLPDAGRLARLARLALDGRIEIRVNEGASGEPER